MPRPDTIDITPLGAIDLGEALEERGPGWRKLRVVIGIATEIVAFETFGRELDGSWYIETNDDWPASR